MTHPRWGALLKTADTAHTEGPSAFAKTGEHESKAAELELRHVSKRYPGQRSPAISDLSLTVPAGEVCVLVGPSGSGKTTAMRLINRMIPISGGDIALGGRSVLQRDARELRREIGYVIQQIGLFPHQTVAENIATVPGLLGWPKQRIAARVQELLELIGLDGDGIGGRYPAQLSGGQRQRVGVARALAADPPLMLMDEPFGAIDPINRARLQDEFLALQRKVKKTIVFVTHDIDEAIKMGDRIAILREGGRLAQYDTPREILTHPADEFVAQFVGADRGIKRLSLTTLAELKLIEPNGTRPSALRAPPQTSVRDALSMILTANGAPLAVVERDGNGGERVRGLLTLGLIERLLADEAAAR
ncbi:MAG TPA: ABC transporter ATP-binding protein [Solirubrobacteraceae bacterium]|jgi:osmoprotectant transport system ATP-binding protein|nr:ABC transporter ATP-binding protein [Solirubrobacteraceae bacterium]